jgi:hypothetical protein
MKTIESKERFIEDERVERGFLEDDRVKREIE